MPQDVLQISLEHHRAGRLVQAEAGYRAVLQSNPDDVEAMHWLGIILCQAGQYPEAIKLLEGATTRKPDDAAYQHNLGQAYLAVRNKDKAIAAFEAAVAIDPNETKGLVALAKARLSRGLPGDAEAAVAALHQAGAGQADQPGLSHHLGVALLASGQAHAAIDICRTALAKSPDDAILYYHLALAYRAAGEMAETRKALIKALEIEPTMAQGWCALAMLDSEAGNNSSAAGLFRRAIVANYDYVAAYEGLGWVMEQMGKHDEARTAFENARRATEVAIVHAQNAAQYKSVAELERHLTPTPEQAKAHFAMAALMNVFPPAQAPADSVAGLFDRYAPNFDRHLVEVLGYHTPEKLIDALKPWCEGRTLDVLDAGCGTGLCGPLLRPLAKTLVGVDLSSAMVEKARDRGIYDRLEVGDLVEFLRREPQAYDLLVCADVLIYIGEAAPFFEAAAYALRPGGLMAFSVESNSGDRYDLIPRSRRYTHSKAYIERLAMIYGYKEAMFETIVVRHEADKPVLGYLVVLHAPMHHRQ